MAVFRAVETRTTVVRAANTGVSCFINPRGEIKARLRANREGVLAEALQLCPDVTLYVRRGDVFGVLCLALALALPGLLFALRRRGRAA
jgi:apolipoprotein N-acyltransferase